MCRPGALRYAVLLLAGSSCTTEPTPGTDVGALRVSVSTNGVDFDLDGYTVQVDGVHTRTINAFGTTTFSDLTAGSHLVELSGLADNCVPGSETRLSVAVTKGGVARADFAVDCPGTGVEVSVSATGLDIARSFSVLVDGLAQGNVYPSSSIRVTRLSAGVHEVSLASVGNCSVNGANPRSVDVLARQIVPISFDLSCVAATGSTTYERETPHSAGGRHSRYVIRTDGTFQLHDGTGADTTIYTGRWTSACCWFGLAIEPGTVILLDFDGFHDSVCGAEGFGTFLLDGHLGIAYCWEGIQAGLEEGVYTSAPIPGTPGPPPPQAGQIAFVREGRIYLANTDGGGLVQLSAGPGDGDPAWSPDGSRIAFMRSGGGATSLFIMDAEGGNVVQRSTSGLYQMGSPTWSPDGQWIAFACWGGQRGLCKVRADTDGTTPVSIYQTIGLAH